MSRLLFKGPFVPYVADLAEKVGLLESLILQLISYWLYENASREHNYKDSRYWVYNSMDEWHKQFKCVSKRTVEAAFAKLEKEGYLYVAYYNENKFDKTKWYSIDYNRLDSLLHDIDKGDEVWNRIRKNCGMGKMGVSEGQESEDALKAAKNPYRKNCIIDTAEFAESYIYKEGKEKKHAQAREENLLEKEEQAKPTFIPKDWEATQDLRKKVQALYRLDEKTLIEAEIDFRAFHLEAGTKMLMWDKLFLGWCERRPKHVKPKTAKKALTPEESIAECEKHIDADSKRGDLDKQIFKEVLHTVGADKWARDQLWNLRVKDVVGNCLRLERYHALIGLGGYRYYLDTILNAVRTLRTEITRVEIV